MKLKSVAPSLRHQSIRDGIIAFIRKDMADVPAEEILAVVSYTVGQLVAMQDQRKFTPEMAMEIVATNIEVGNRHMLSEVAGATHEC